MTFTLKNKILTYSLIFAIIILAVLFTVIYPTIKQIEQVHKQTYDLRQYLEQKNKNSSRLHLSVQRINEVKKEAASFPNYIFKTGDELILITNLESIATKNNLTQKIESSNFDNITNHTAVLSLTTLGGYLNTIKYLNDLEKLNYFISVQRLELTPATSRGVEISKDVNMRLNLNLYVNN